MRRVPLDNALPEIPTNGYVEVFQDQSASGNLGKQYLAVSQLGFVTDEEDLQTVLDGFQETLDGFEDDVTAVEGDITTLEASVAALEAGGTVAAVVATVGGGTTGLIPATASIVEVTTDNIDKQISLPAAVDGKELRIRVAATGCELISAVAADKVNNVVVGATNEAALVAGTLYTLKYIAATDNWVMTGYTATGGVETPVIPDALV